MRAHRFTVIFGDLDLILRGTILLAPSVLLLLAVASSALAAGGTWNSTAATGAWQTSTNWLSGIIPGATSGTTNTDTATFNSSSTTTTIVPDLNRNLENITFDTAAAAYTIGTTGGNALLLTSGGTIQIANTYSGGFVFETINAPLTLEGNYTFAANSNSGAQLVFDGAITLAAGNNLTVTGVSTTYIPGTIGGGAGTIALAKNGAGTLQLSGTNTFTGGVTINAGAVYVTTAGGLNSNAVTFGAASTGILQLGTGLTVTGLSTNATIGTPVVQNSSGVPETLTVNNSFTNTFAGVLQNGLFGGPISLVKGGAGSLILSGNNTFTGGVTVSAGAGTLSLSGNNTFTGGVTINGGTVQVANANALNSSAPNAVTFGPGSNGILSLNGNTITVSGLNTNATVGTPVVNNSGSLNPATLTVNIASGTNTFAGSIQDGALSGPLSLTKTGAGTLIFGGANTFTGPVHVNNGTLELAENFTQAVSANLFVGDGIGAPGSAILLTDGSPVFPNSGANVTIQTDGVLNFGGSSNNETINTLNMTGGTITGGGIPLAVTLASDVTTNASGSTAAIVAGGYVLVLSGPARTFTVAQGTTPSGIDLDISGELVSNGVAGLIKNGLGTMRLSNAVNGFSGGVTLNAGTLIVGSNSALGSGTLTAGGGTLQADSNGPYTVSNAVNLASTLFVSGSNDFTLSGPISGGGGITKTGSGALTLSGVESFTGPINVNGGTLAMNTSLTSNVTNLATFVYNSGTFGGRLTNLGTVVLNADFTAGNGMENDGNFSLATGRTVTLNGAGLDNEGTLNMTGGTLTLSATGSNVNRGNFNLSATLSLSSGPTTYQLTNQGSLALNGGLISGSGGLLTNGAGGTISGTGMISSGFTNSAGAIVIGPGTMNITQAFSNGGGIQLAAINANLTGGTISNTGTIQGFGNLGSPVNNTSSGIVEASGGTLFVTGSTANLGGGTLTADAGAKLLVTQGLAMNSGLINLTGGTFDNNNHPLTNIATGEISGWGIFRTGGTGLDNLGSVTFTGGTTTVFGPVTNENLKTITIAYNPAIFTGMVTNTGTGTFHTISTTATFAGGFSGTFTNNVAANFVAAGTGALEIDGPPTLNNASSLSVNDTSTLRFNATSGAASVGTGVTATVASGATLELAGSVSALSSGSNRVNITNNSPGAPGSAGVLVSGTNQVVGNIDGSGTTQVNAGSDLTANHIIQNALIIGGTASSHGLVIIDPSDASGSPLAESPAHASGSGFADSFDSSAPFGAGASGSSGSSPLGAEGFSGDPIPAGALLDAANLSGNPSTVPEPATLLLLAAGGLACLAAALRQRARVC